MNDPLSTEDKALVDEARHIITERFKANRHHIGCALRARSGKIFSSVHLEANVGRVAVCAESIAIGIGAAAGDTDIDTIVAVNRLGAVVAPCGACRELISDYSPTARVIVPSDNGNEVVCVTQLLPKKYAGKNET